ncbi:MAG: hypothetical protein ABGW87_08430 [Sphingomonadaceae bacterium]
MMAKDWRLVILAVYAAALAYLMVDAGRPDSAGWFGFAAFFMAFALAPLALLCLTRSHVRIKGIAAIVLAAGGLWVIVDTLYLAAPDAQSALVFTVVPALQWIGAMLVLVGLLVMGRMGKGS